jgi:hypothetical protein
MSHSAFGAGGGEDAQTAEHPSPGVSDLRPHPVNTKMALFVLMRASAVFAYALL